MNKRPVWDRPPQPRNDLASLFDLAFREIDEEWKARQLWEGCSCAWGLLGVAHLIAVFFHHHLAKSHGFDARWINEPLVILGVALSIIAFAMYRLSLLIKSVWLPVFCLCWIALGFTFNFAMQYGDKISMGAAFIAAISAIAGVRAALYWRRQKLMDHTTIEE